jgi:glycosyltransferase involved in cell wall biosynthesis
MIGRAGFVIDRLDPGPPPNAPDDVQIPRVVLARPQRWVTSGPAAGLPSLRWAIKIAARPGPCGDGWGDVHFAAALTRSLERLGQEVVVDRRESYLRETAYLDDVVLVIRGLEHVPVRPEQVNLLWVISHPDLVTPDELRSYDAAFAASLTWSARMTAEGTPVQPLLQATDPQLFNPELARSDRTDRLLFVGRSRNVLRPIVRDAVEAGLDLSLYGDGWEQFGLAEHVRATFLPNEKLGEAYASAEIVLNDHWADMAAEGFISNRVFDALACGARVISDRAEGLAELFGDAVQVYSSVEDLARLCGPGGLDTFPDREARQTLAKRIGVEHSFDARARELLDSALAVRESRATTRRAHQEAAAAAACGRRAGINSVGGPPAVVA